MSKIKAVIFDWGRTLYDKEEGKLFSSTKRLLSFCYKRYPLCIVSLASDDDMEKRFALLDKYKIRKYFKFALFHSSDKDSLFRNAVGNFGLKPNQVLIVDDRIKRLGWGIKNGCKTIWIKKGKYENEKIDPKVGKPTLIASNLDEALELIEKM